MTTLADVLDLLHEPVRATTLRIDAHAVTAPALIDWARVHSGGRIDDATSAPTATEIRRDEVRLIVDREKRATRSVVTAVDRTTDTLVVDGDQWHLVGSEWVHDGAGYGDPWPAGVLLDTRPLLSQLALSLGGEETIAGRRVAFVHGECRPRTHLRPLSHGLWFADGGTVEMAVDLEHGFLLAATCRVADVVVLDIAADRVEVDGGLDPELLRAPPIPPGLAAAPVTMWSGNVYDAAAAVPYPLLVPHWLDDVLDVEVDVGETDGGVHSWIALSVGRFDARLSIHQSPVRADDDSSPTDDADVDAGIDEVVVGEHRYRCRSAGSSSVVTTVRHGTRVRLHGPWGVDDLVAIAETLERVPPTPPALVETPPS